VRKADNLPPSCADVKKSGGLNLLETCGSVQACNGTALPFIIIITIVLQWPTIFSTVTCCTGLQPRSNSLYMD
jgi:hypothetical protein